MDTAEMGELDALTIRHNAETEAWGHRIEEGNYNRKAGIHTASRKSPLTGAAGSLLTGAGRFADKYYEYIS
jgi:hypothetical protein